MCRKIEELDQTKNLKKEGKDKGVIGRLFSNGVGPNVLAGSCNHDCQQARPRLAKLNELVSWVSALWDICLPRSEDLHYVCMGNGVGNHRNMTPETAMADELRQGFV